MYIDPFWIGVMTTIVVEVLLLLIVGFHNLEDNEDD